MAPKEGIMKRSGLACLAVFLFGCGDDALPEASPSGVVQGEVWDGTTFAPISGVSVTLEAGTEQLTAISDEVGRFVLRSVPAGSALSMILEATGYARARSTVAIDDEAGEHPQSNSIADVLLLLFPNDNELTVEVVDPDDDPIPGITVIAVPEDIFFAGEETVVLDRPSATTGSNGEAELPGLATWVRYSVYSLPTDEYPSAGDSFRPGFESGPLTIVLTPFDYEPPVPACNGDWEYCCDVGDPCFYADDGWCDCPMCTWDDWDCY